MAVTNSIVDYLNSQGKDSSYSARKSLAAQYGISNYQGTASQNTQLLNTLRNSGSSTTASTPSPSAAVTSGIEQITDNTPNYSAPTTSSSSSTPSSTTTKSYQSGFVPTETTSHYKTQMLDTEDERPDEYTSKYESTIDSILDTIKNKGKFDVTTDTNYNALYNTYKERYEAQADKAMRDTLASANASTGGYGSTYGQVAAQQAYDNTMQGLNDQNLNLMQLAYQIYGDDVANDYNKLNAFQTQDNTDYSRYRDTVSDWESDRNYYANQYWNSWQNDRSAYESDRSFDYGVDKDTADQEYEQYSDALNLALNLAKNGQSVPSYLTETIDKYNTAHGLSGGSADSLAALASQVAAGTSTGSSSSGGSSSGSSKKSGSSSKKSGSSSSGSTSSSSNSASSGTSSSTYGLSKLLDSSLGALSLANVASSSSIPTYHGTSTVVDSGDSGTTQITNRNGDGWVYVDGLGKVTTTELQKYVNNGTVKETVSNGKYTYRYNKKSNSSSNAHYKEYGKQ